ncbi:MAG TPA: HEPN domain-containing protein [Anaerolineae bacterium]|nr:HEPN domain-containing protein [Anaerolineae bacterium]
MSFDWSEYFALAQELVGQATSPSSQEARLRSAISRAYYAAFCKARNYLRDREGHSIPRGGQVHRYVRNQFKKSSDKVRKEVGENLNRLRKDRNKADYDDTVTRLPAITRKTLKLAGRVISRLDDL